jgi:Mn-dependent DtxR family transcriptional regulator
MTEVAELIKDYERQVPVKELAERFGVHRLTVTALLRRHGVQLRRAGKSPQREAEGFPARGQND